MIVLGLETSCDETAAAVVRDDRRILSNLVLSQLDEHRPFGGVVPEVAARAHLAYLPKLIERALGDAGIAASDLDGVAATAGPGLIGALLVGLTAGKALAYAAGKPFVAVNHLEAHALTARLTEGIAFPYLLLLVSGGHCQLVEVEGVGKNKLLGTTLDDAVGEAFDKAARLLGLAYPGGPAVEQAARSGDARRFALPRPMHGRSGADFSFAGLKTALRHAVAALPAPPDEQTRADLAASFQAAVADSLADRAGHALARFAATHQGIAPVLVLAGGVAANMTIRAALALRAEVHGAKLVAPPPALCTDNAAMIAWAGIERLQLGLVDGFDAPARPRWPLAGAAG
ncbi:MAG: tRNA (adenosine(37)-N6)-threonylcarbamoyltransferase complex transferase subunit TsaD [Alphaproteobacteria bacterium]|nr:tRNA (adenosine(37)-N6)-threonylcarbamoyltransferase complex transferase subunit TsaD [Alphaproteobacteria bacterium]